MKVQLIAATAIRPALEEIMPNEGGASTEGEKLVTFAGRACYRSFHRPNPATAEDRDYIRSTAIEKGHGSILEHASATFYVTGVSRALTHELLRHRAGTAYSELSQRFVDIADVEFVMPPALRAVGVRPKDWQRDLAEVFPDIYSEVSRGLEKGGVVGKRNREAARSVMPNAAATEIVVTANYRAWRHIIRLRGSEAADAEIREFALAVLEQLYDEAPSVFGDFSVVKLADGREVVE